MLIWVLAFSVLLQLAHCQAGIKVGGFQQVSNLTSSDLLKVVDFIKGKHPNQIGNAIVSDVQTQVVSGLNYRILFDNVATGKFYLSQAYVQSWNNIYTQTNFSIVDTQSVTSQPQNTTNNQGILNNVPNSTAPSNSTTTTTADIIVGISVISGPVIVNTSTNQTSGILPPLPTLPPITSTNSINMPNNATLASTIFQSIRLPISGSTQVNSSQTTQQQQTPNYSSGMTQAIKTDNQQAHAAPLFAQGSQQQDLTLNTGVRTNTSISQVNMTMPPVPSTLPYLVSTVPTMQYTLPPFGLPIGCQTMDISNGTCIACQPGYFLGSKGLCGVYDPFCVSYNPQDFSCLSCGSGYRFNGTSCAK